MFSDCLKVAVKQMNGLAYRIHKTDLLVEAYHSGGINSPLIMIDCYRPFPEENMFWPKNCT